MLHYRLYPKDKASLIEVFLYWEPAYILFQFVFVWGRRLGIPGCNAEVRLLCFTLLVLRIEYIAKGEDFKQNKTNGLAVTATKTVCPKIVARR